MDKFPKPTRGVNWPNMCGSVRNIGFCEWSISDVRGAEVSEMLEKGMEERGAGGGGYFFLVIFSSLQKKKKWQKKKVGLAELVSFLIYF